MKWPFINLHKHIKPNVQEMHYMLCMIPFKNEGDIEYLKHDSSRNKMICILFERNKMYQNIPFRLSFYSLLRYNVFQ